ncbi:hypothetical protein [Marinococcus sp. PL1-022]|uniref:hypothetical protein n=1 Tax=Marinococcus sp. PL1-022 TaxID=3095363 RepID=UPI0029C5789C|nr:hypothetical protein [Marinococcus sp. PL1-022]MDX6153126.1 hypothetical protein [Marinococcus sp. PL1-022]
MNKTYADSYRRRRSGKISCLMVFAAGILLWKYYRQTSSSQDAWTAAILRHVVDPEQSREEQKEQMKKAFRLAEAAGTTKQEMAQAYQHMAPEAFRFKKHQ